MRKIKRRAEKHDGSRLLSKIPKKDIPPRDPKMLRRAGSYLIGKCVTVVLYTYIA